MPDLDFPFTKMEIDQAIKDMPTDQAPGPDGCNGHFMKKCWGIISQDFYRLCDQFWQGTVDLTSINGSFIALIPKKDNPFLVNIFSLFLC